MGTIASVLLRNESLQEIAPFCAPRTSIASRTGKSGRHPRARPARRARLTATSSPRSRCAGKLDEVGGDEYLLEMMQAVPHAANARYYAQVVQQLAIRRDSPTRAGDARRVLRDPLHGRRVAERAEGRLFAIADSRRVGEIAAADVLMRDALDHITQGAEGGHSGLETGFCDFDDMAGGLAGLVVVAGRPSMGKTAWALGVVDHVAVTLAQPVLVISLEMGKFEVAERMIVARRGSTARLRRRGLPSDLVGRPAPLMVR